MIRVGIGYDVHRLVLDRKLILGGVEVEYHMGLAGHSDADVLSHAIGDALLGAASLGDLGVHFPPGIEKWKNISSLILLEHIKNLVNEKGYRIVNIDSIIIAQRPKLKGYISEMRERVSRVLGVDSEYVSIKATTTEKLGFAGRGEGIASEAVCLIEKI